jgi:hypothetical protein
VQNTEDEEFLFCFLPFFLFSGDTGVWTQGFTFAKQTLHCTWATPPVHFAGVMWRFWRWGLVKLLAWPGTAILLISSLQVARITGVTHRCLASASFLRFPGLDRNPGCCTSWCPTEAGLLLTLTPHVGNRLSLSLACDISHGYSLDLCCKWSDSCTGR